jgi:hypothetical protein
MKKAQPRITQEEVDEFAVICARMKQDDTRRRVLREKFLEARSMGWKIPDAGPHLIHFTDKEKSDVKWKDEAQFMARALLGSKSAADELIAAIELDAGKSPVVEVSPKPNPNWVAMPNVTVMPLKKAKAKGR